jgi:hypothetical protein
MLDFTLPFAFSKKISFEWTLLSQVRKRNPKIYKAANGIVFHESVQGLPPKHLQPSV